uniref:Reverse transcriptase domain-containing protein n=1 Tax=Cannabis sativa TaxID=3483 RepID=A0A803P267_CANSA
MDQQYAAMSLGDDDDGFLMYVNDTVDTIDFDDKWCLVGRFLTDRTIDFEAMQHKMASLWRPVRDRVMEGSPWTFDRIPLIFERLKSGENPRSIIPMELIFWVQIHGLKAGFRSERVLKDLGNYMGSYVKMDPNNFLSGWRDYLRPYNLDMKAPPRRRTHSMGARWLRTEMAVKTSGESSATPAIDRSTTITKAVPSEEIIMGENQGVDGGSDAIMGNQDSVEGEGINGNKKGKSIVTENGSEEDDGQIILEQKRRRVTIVCQEDKQGGNRYPRGLIEGFLQVLSDCELIDMEIIGHPYTWEKNRGGGNWVEVRLDRALISSSWFQMFSNAKLYNLHHSTSDHSPIFLEPEIPVQMGGTRSFKFENAWLKEPMCFQIIQGCWEETNGEDIWAKQQLCVDKLGEWGKTITGNFKRRINACKRELDLLKHRRDGVSVERYKEVKKQLLKVIDQKETYWKQRAKQFWLKEGDQNTKYFHAAANTRRRTNSIHQLKNEQGVDVIWNSGLELVITDYFAQLFSSSSSITQPVVECVDRMVTPEMNETFLLTVTEDEVRTAIFGMHPDKSPGPDGLTPAFYQKNWAVVGLDVVKLVQRFFTSGKFENDINKANVVLIPKKRNHERMTDLRPIALCNVLYKTITKVMANRLKPIMDRIVSQHQSAFIPGRLITDNIMVSFEVLHYLKRKRRGKEGFMALKLDMSKAYDRIEWKYLEEILLRLGFEHGWIALMMERVRSASYLIVHGGKTMGPIIPQRGIRQATMEEALKVRELLTLFEQASGQQVNFGKSSIFYSTNTNLAIRNSIGSFLQMVVADENSMYLGLPSTMGRRKEVLIKTVAQALPSYAMSVFLLRLDISHEMEQCMAKFWWKTTNSKESGIHWKSWEKLCQHKSVGGLSFRNLRDHNIALLGKQGWRLLTNSNSLVSRIFKARYYPNGTYLSASIGNNPSFIWRSIFEAQKVVKMGARWRIGIDSQVPVKGEPWLSLEENPFITSTHPVLDSAVVGNLMEIGSGSWDMELLQDVFNNRDIASITAVPILQVAAVDSFTWHFELSGTYSVKSAFHLLQKEKGAWDTVEASKFWNELWRLKIPPKIKNLIWRRRTNCLPTKVQLITKRVQVDSLCPVCDSHNETIMHVLAFCPIAAQCWEKAAIRIPTQQDTSFLDCQEYGYGMVARDEHGFMLEATSRLCHGCVRPELAEAIGVREALS